MENTEQPTENTDQGVKKILDEDKNKIIDEFEIRRIIKLYIGRSPSDDEISRFSGMKESERKILVDYVETERTSQKDQNELGIKGNKIQGDLMLKGMKTMGNNNLEAMKMGQPPMQTPAGMGQPSSNMGMGANPMQPQPASPSPQSGGSRFVPEGRFSLVQFRG